MSAAFITANLVLLPFAYIKTCYLKVILFRNRVIALHACLGYFLLGPLVLLISQLTDLVAFLRVSFTRDKIYAEEEIVCIDEKDFHLFYRIIEKINAK